MRCDRDVSQRSAWSFHRPNAQTAMCACGFREGLGVTQLRDRQGRATARKRWRFQESVREMDATGSGNAVAFLECSLVLGPIVTAHDPVDQPETRQSGKRCAT